MAGYHNLTRIARIWSSYDEVEALIQRKSFLQLLWLYFSHSWVKKETRMLLVSELHFLVVSKIDCFCEDFV